MFLATVSLPTTLSDMFELGALIVAAALAAFLVSKNASVIGRFASKAISAITGRSV